MGRDRRCRRCACPTTTIRPGKTWPTTGTRIKEEVTQILPKEDGIRRISNRHSPWMSRNSSSGSRISWKGLRKENGFKISSNRTRRMVNSNNSGFKISWRISNDHRREIGRDSFQEDNRGVVLPYAWITEARKLSVGPVLWVLATRDKYRSRGSASTSSGKP